ncbi:MAG: MlaE family ABC transporter permease [Acidobacteriota bacterium]
MSSALAALRRFVVHCGGVVVLTWRAFAALPRRPLEIERALAEMDQVGVRSLAVAAITTVFAGMVIALQTAYSLPELGVKYYIGTVVSKSLVRELSPALVALVVGGRVGAGMTAELGSMAVTEQIEALRAMGADPVKKLVAPKLLASLIMLPALTVIGDLLGILGGLFIAVFELGITARFYNNDVIAALSLDDVGSGLGKSFFFATAIAMIACYNGLRVRGGASGVGRATTDTVVQAAIVVLISDFFLTKLFFLL